MSGGAYDINGRLADAAAFYAVACDPRRSVAVEACAGAGKTWMLVSRMLRALLEPTERTPGQAGGCAPQEILAITFTRKAAGEMRGRLYEWLRDFAQASPEQLLEALAQRGVPGLDDPSRAQALCAQLQGLYARVLASGRPVQIRTFHSWFSALLRHAPVAVLQELALPVQYELLEDDAQAKALVWRRFYERLLAEPEARADFEALVREHGRFQTDKALQAALDKRVEFALADAAGVVDHSIKTLGEQFPDLAGVQDLAEVLGRASVRDALGRAASVLSGLSAKTFAAAGLALREALDAADLDGVLRALLTKDHTPRNFRNASSDPDIRQAQDLALHWVQAQGQQQAWHYQQRMARLARLLLAEYAALKRERGWVDMNDIECAALRMLGDEVLSGWVQEKLDAQVRHLLIDEFQDTNPLQWQALRAWLSSYAGAGRAPSVFLVGDPKQSIYRFRRAEPQVFRAAQHFVREGLGGDVLSCDHTRRNAHQVIAAVNSALGAAAASADDAYQGFRPHTTASKHAGQVQRLPMVPRSTRQETAAAEAQEAEKTDESAVLAWRDSLHAPRDLPEETLRTQEARQAAAWLAAQIGQRGLKPQDVMVLSRKRENLLPMQQALRSLGIAAEVGEKIALMDCCEVQDLVALLDVLVSPRHDLSLARVLRSPIFGLPDTALVPLALAARRTQLHWLALLQAESGSVPELAQPEAAPLQGLGERLGRWQHWVQALPPHDALQSIYGDGDLLARFAAAAPAAQRPAVLANLRALLMAALNHEGGRFITPYALVRALKAGGMAAPATVSEAAVRLLTIHGAKGLEAELVLLLDTHTPPRAGESMGVLLDWPGEYAHPQRFAFLLSESRPPACSQLALEAEQQARHREELNTLYVAMTRARQVLGISAIEPARPTSASWWERLEGLAQAVEHVEAGAAPAAAHESLVQLPVLPALPQALRPERLEEAQDSVASRLGQAMHRLLEWGALGADHVRAVAREFRLDQAQAEQARAAAQRIFQGEGAWAWQPAQLLWQGSEVELAHEGQLLRLDRLVHHRETGWWVLDYKSAAQPDTQTELVAQMRAYQRAVQSLYAGAAVRAAFLTAEGRLIELAPA